MTKTTVPIVTLTMERPETKAESAWILICAAAFVVTLIDVLIGAMIDMFDHAGESMPWTPVLLLIAVTAMSSTIASRVSKRANSTWLRANSEDIKLVASINLAQTLEVAYGGQDQRLWTTGELAYINQVTIKLEPRVVQMSTA